MVVVMVGDAVDGRCNASGLGACLEALARQTEPPQLEILVPHHGNVDGIEELRRRFPGVIFLRIDDLATFTGGGGREHHDELRARAVAAAGGEIVALIEDQVRPETHWASRVFQAHRSSAAGIGGAIGNAVDRPLNWAVCFCEFSRYLDPPAGPSRSASDVNASYKRSRLETIRSVWEKSFRETAVNDALLVGGQSLALDPGIVVYLDRPGLRLGDVCRERFLRGRSYAARRPGRALYAVLAPMLPVILLGRITAAVARRPRRWGAFLRAFLFTVLLVLSWSLGEWIGYLTGSAE